MTYTPTHTKTGKPLEHGTPATYTNHGCRCQSCREANTAAMADYRARAGPEYSRRNRLQKDAYSAAERALRRNHRPEFDALYAIERRRRGLDQ